MFGLRGCAFRFGNVVGPARPTGSASISCASCSRDPTSCASWAMARQSKSYIHVEDVVNAVLLAAARKRRRPFEVYNVATGDYITVKEIARHGRLRRGPRPVRVRFVYSGGDRGWKGDVPIVRLNTDRIRALGWRCSRGSAQALRDSMAALVPDARAKRL